MTTVTIADHTVHSPESDMTYPDPAPAILAPITSVPIQITNALIRAHDAARRADWDAVQDIALELRHAARVASIEARADAAGVVRRPA